MSNYWAGYSGIGMMLSETELEEFIEKYRKLRSAELEEYCKHLIYVPDYDDDDECEKRDFIDMILKKEGGFALSDAFAEGFSFFPYVYLHKVTRYVVDYCKKKDIRTVVIGDLTNIRKDKDLGHVTNQKLHALPYKKIYTMLEYKLAMEGIRLVKQKESYSSQCSPMSASVGKKYACKANRVKRGLYQDKDYSWNADCVGAFNILRLYFQETGIIQKMEPHGISTPHVIKVAV